MQTCSCKQAVFFRPLSAAEFMAIDKQTTTYNVCQKKMDVWANVRKLGEKLLEASTLRGQLSLKMKLRDN